MKLTRKQIKEGLESVPMAEIILGAGNPTNQKLTAKQLKFAEEIAKGETKAGAYRKAYKSKGKPETQSKRGQELVKNRAIEGQIAAFKAANEAAKYLLPAHLRALTIHQLTIKALDPELAPAQQIRCLELIGKMTEVSLFTERREIVHTNDSGSLRDQLLSSLRLAIRSSSAVTVDSKSKASQLLAELSEGSSPAEDEPETMDASPDTPDQQSISALDGEGSEIQISEPPREGMTPFLASASSAPLHSISHIQSPTKVSLTPVSVTNPSESDTCVSISINPNMLERIGEGVSNPNWVENDSVIKTPPSSFSNQKG